jgi:vancomycin resistance protein VanW
VSIAHRTLRKITPMALRRVIAQARRTFSDHASGLHAQIARPGAAAAAMPAQLTLAQPIFETPTSHGKIVNLQRAAALLSAAQIPPGGVFSFWSLVGAPTRARGFVMGRAIVADEVSQDVGGGLCQLSGLIYELGLRGGLDVVERHAHSRDLYTDETRFAPLGLDATVGFAFKDLRLRNAHNASIAFTFDIAKDRVEARLHAHRAIAACALDVVMTETPTHREVRVARRRADGAVEPVSADRYAIEAR